MQEEIKIDLCEEGNIINYYVAFTKIYNEQVKLHGSNMSEPKLCLKQDTKIPKNMKKSTCLFCM